MCVRVCVCACMRACVRACVRACMRLCDVGVCVCTLEEKALKGLLLYNSTTFAVFGLK